MSLCIVIPAFNEEKSIGQTIKAYKRVFPDATFIVVDNNSTDSTCQKASEALEHSRDCMLTVTDQGKGHAVRAALSRKDADYYLITDADATYPASDALSLYREIKSLRLDMVIGDRISGGAYAEQNERNGHAFGNRLLTQVVSALSQKKFTDVLSGLRIISKPLVSMAEIKADGFQVEAELSICAADLNATIKEIPISYDARPAGSHSKLRTYRDGLKILMFTLSKWVHLKPLQPFFVTSIIGTTLASLCAYRLWYIYVNDNYVAVGSLVLAGLLSLMSILLLFFGLALKIITDGQKQQRVAIFNEQKRLWNNRLDENL